MDMPVSIYYYYYESMCNKKNLVKSNSFLFTFHHEINVVNKQTDDFINLYIDT